MDIIIEVDREDSASLSELEAHGLTMPTVDKFDGARELAEALIALTPVSIGAVSAVVSKLIEARRHVRIITKHVRIEGLSERATLKALEDLIKDDS